MDFTQKSAEDLHILIYLIISTFDGKYSVLFSDEICLNPQGDIDKITPLIQYCRISNNSSSNNIFTTDVVVVQSIFKFHIKNTILMNSYFFFLFRAKYGSNTS